MLQGIGEGMIRDSTKAIMQKGLGGLREAVRAQSAGR
jgi:hypothetical protein